MDKVAMMVKARRLVKEVSELPTIPAVVSRVITLLDSHEGEPEEIADLILSDQVLAARVIRVVNSPLYHPTSEISSVKRALLYLGFKSVRELILTTYFVDAFSGKPQPFDINAFWIHSFSVGAVSRRIAGMAGYPDVDKAFLVGIIHDIGKVFLGHYLRDEYAEMLASIQGTSYTTYEAEMEFFGTTHSEVGLCLAQRWNFPPVFCDIISYHHTSELATEDPLLTAIVSLADFACLAHAPGNSIAQTGTLGRSEENAWTLLKQLSTRQLAGDTAGFMASLEAGFEEVDREVRHVFSTMVSP